MLTTILLLSVFILLAIVYQLRSRVTRLSVLYDLLVFVFSHQNGKRKTIDIVRIFYERDQNIRYDIFNKKWSILCKSLGVEIHKKSDHLVIDESTLQGIAIQLDAIKAHQRSENID